MTPVQFEAMQQLLRMRGSPALVEAIRLVLVDGLPQYQACAATGVTSPNLCRALNNARRVMVLSATLITGAQYVQS